MIFVIGGAYQGQKEYVGSVFRNVKFTDGRICSLEQAMNAECITDFHMLVKRIMKEVDPISFTEELCKNAPECIVISDEIGCGIIPLEKCERQWREAAGRCGCVIAKNSKAVIRLVCGIPTAIKGKLP